MAGNQREMERRERREQREKKHRLIAWIVVAVVVIILLIMKICEVNINSVKDHFTDANGDFTLTDGIVTDNFPYSIDASQNISLVNANNKIGILTPNSYTVLDSKTATADYVFQHGYSNPILANAGVYSLVYDQGADKFRLDTVSEGVYEEDIENSILCADVSKNGTVALATTSKKKTCDIMVISRSLDTELEMSISSGYVVDIALSDNSKRVAVAVVNSVNADLVTTVYIYNVNNSEEKAVTLPSGVLADIRFAGNSIWAVGNSYAGVIKGDEYKACYEDGTINTQCYTYNQAGALVLVYGNYSNSSQYEISYIKPNGKIKNEFTVDAIVKDASATESLVSVLTTDEILSFNINNGECKEVISCTDSVKSICRLGSSVFIHRQSLIDKGVINDG